MNDQNKKTLRQFQCRDYLWEIFEQMSGELECSVDYLINEAMRQYARSRNYGARGPTPEPTGASRSQAPVSRSESGAPAAPRQRVPSQPAIPSAPPPSARQSGQQGGYGGAPQGNAGYPPPPVRGSGSGGAYPSAPHPSAPHPSAPHQAPPQGYAGTPHAGYPSVPGPQQGGAAQGYGQPGYPPPPAPAQSLHSQPQPPYSQPQGGYGGAPPQQQGYGAPSQPRPQPSSYPPGGQTTRPPAQPGYNAPPPLPSSPSVGPPPLTRGGGGGGAGSEAMPSLFVIFNGQKFPVNKEEFIIGRGTKTADLAIKDGNISRRHAAIIFQNGAFYMKDLGSTNGVEYQGRRVDGRRIEEGDVYQLCDYELRFTYR
jgi:hypothetical protein